MSFLCFKYFVLQIIALKHITNLPFSFCKLSEIKHYYVLLWGTPFKVRSTFCGISNTTSCFSLMFLCFLWYWGLNQSHHTEQSPWPFLPWDRVLLSLPRLAQAGSPLACATTPGGLAFLTCAQSCFLLSLGHTGCSGATAVWQWQWRCEETVLWAAGPRPAEDSLVNTAERPAQQQLGLQRRRQERRGQNTQPGQLFSTAVFCPESRSSLQKVCDPLERAPLPSEFLELKRGQQIESKSF